MFKRERGKGKEEQQDEKQKKETSWGRKRSNEDKRYSVEAEKKRRVVKVASVNKKSDKCNDQMREKKRENNKD
ncbi:MAG UNVERIFIED_CONTAM: hypothetical protein LVR29_05230 [Microcystis novacekii LVE1205-3]